MAIVHEQPDDSSPQIRALRQCTRDLVKAIHAADLLDITWQLFKKPSLNWTLLIIVSCKSSPHKRVARYSQ